MQPGNGILNGDRAVGARIRIPIDNSPDLWRVLLEVAAVADATDGFAATRQAVRLAS